MSVAAGAIGRRSHLPPEPWETGFKDTVIAYPGQVTRIKATFDLPGQFVWHCHIVEHEDNEMMRPLSRRAESLGRKAMKPQNNFKLAGVAAVAFIGVAVSAGRAEVASLSASKDNTLYQPASGGTTNSNGAGEHSSPAGPTTATSAAG